MDISVGCIIQLSNVNCFDRQYSSITDAIADGLPHVDFKKTAKLVYESASKGIEAKLHLFIIDCTPNPRPYARKLVDRHITHHPNPAPGNKPIVVGHQYSVLTILPNNNLEKGRRWVIPLSAQRVESCKKGNEVGMEQIADSISTLDLGKELCIMVGDTLYGTEQCRVSPSKQSNLVHIFRVNSKRNLYSKPIGTESRVSQKGRNTEFGNKMNLSDVKTHRVCDRYEEKSLVNSKGKKYTIQLKCWDDMLLRGSRKYHSSEHSMNLIQITILNDKKRRCTKDLCGLAYLGKDVMR